MSTSPPGDTSPGLSESEMAMSATSEVTAQAAATGSAQTAIHGMAPLTEGAALSNTAPAHTAPGPPAAQTATGGAPLATAQGAPAQGMGLQTSPSGSAAHGAAPASASATAPATFHQSQLDALASQSAQQTGLMLAMMEQLNKMNERSALQEREITLLKEREEEARRQLSENRRLREEWEEAERTGDIQVLRVTHPRQSVVGIHGITNAKTGGTPNRSSYGIELQTPGTALPSRRSEVDPGTGNTVALNSIKPPSLSELTSMALDRFPASSGPGSSDQSSKERKKISRENGLTSQKLKAAAKLLRDFRIDADSASHLLVQLCEPKLGGLLSDKVALGARGSWDEACKFLLGTTVDTVKTNEFRNRLKGGKHNAQRVNGYLCKGVQFMLEGLDAEAEDFGITITPHDVFEIWTACLRDHQDLVKAVVLEWTSNQAEYLSGGRTSQDILAAVLVVETALMVTAQHSKGEGKKVAAVTIRQDDPSQTSYGNRAQRKQEPASSRSRDRSRDGGRQHHDKPRRTQELYGESQYERVNSHGQPFYAVGPGNGGTPQQGGYKGCRLHGRNVGDWIGHKESDHQPDPPPRRTHREAHSVGTGSSKRLYKGKACGVMPSSGSEQLCIGTSSEWSDVTFLFDTGCTHTVMTMDYAKSLGLVLREKPYPETYDASNNTTFTVYHDTEMALRVGDNTIVIDIDVHDGPLAYQFMLSDDDGERLGFEVSVPPGAVPVYDDSGTGHSGSHATIKGGTRITSGRAGPLPMNDQTAEEVAKDAAEDEARHDDLDNRPFGPQTEPVMSVTDDHGRHLFWAGTYYNSENTIFYGAIIDELKQHQVTNQQRTHVNPNFPRCGLKLLPGAAPPQAEGTTTPLHIREYADKFLKDMEDEGMIVREEVDDRNLHTRSNDTASVRAFLKVKPQKDPKDPPKLRLLFDSRALNRVLDTRDRLNTNLPSLEEFQRTMSAHNVMSVGDADAGYQQIGVRYLSRPEGDDSIDDRFLHNGEVAICFTIDRRRYRMATLAQGVAISPDVFYSATIHRDPTILDYKELRHSDTYMDDNATGATADKIPVSPSKLQHANDLYVKQKLSYEELAKLDLSPFEGEEPVMKYDLRDYMTRVRKHYAVQNGHWGFKDNPKKTWHLMRKVVLGGLLVGCGEIELDSVKRIHIAKLATPATCQALRQTVHYLLWLCKLAPNVAALLDPCYKYCNKEDKGPLRKVAGGDYNIIAESIRKVCYELSNAKPINSIEPNTTLVVISDCSFDYMSGTLTQVSMDVSQIDNWGSAEWEHFTHEANNRVISHYSKTMPPGSENKGIGFCELWACTQALEHFAHWTQGRYTLLINDNKTAIATLTSGEVSKQVWRLIAAFNKHYNVKPVWVEGKVDLGCVDSGSRLPHDGVPTRPDILDALRDPGTVTKPENLKTAYVTTRSKMTGAGEERRSATPPTPLPTTPASNTHESSVQVNGEVPADNKDLDSGQGIKGSSAKLQNSRRTEDYDPNQPKKSRARTSPMNPDFIEEDVFNPDLPDSADDQILIKKPTKVLPWNPEYHEATGAIKPPRSSARLRQEYKKGTLFEPPDRLVQEILGITHSMSGHYGNAQMQHHLIRLGFWVSNFADAAKGFKARCEACQRHDIAIRKFNEVDRGTWYTTRAFKVVAMDTGAFPADKYDMTTVSTITCVFTGFSDVRAYPDKSSSSYVDHLKNFIRTFGPPEKVCADGAYYGGEFQQFCEDMQIKLSVIPAYYPQGNGIAEDCQKRVKTMLAKFTSSDPSTWSEELWRIQFTINNNLRTRLGTTPYYAVFHQHPTVPGQESDGSDGPPDDAKDLERLKNRIDLITPIEVDALLMRLDR